MKHSLMNLGLMTLALTAVSAKAQNVQLHYDFGSALYSQDYGSRPKLTSTVEMFRTDPWGNTFFFIDMDYTAKGISGGYWEIARELQFWKPPFSLHLEYNGGLTDAFPFQNAYLGGLSYTYNNSTFSKGFTLSALYKYIQKHEEPHNVQLTATWYLHFGANRLCSFSGFADWWREKSAVGDFIFMAEPQFWLNLDKLKSFDPAFKLSVGSELKLTNNFAMHEGFYAIPTLAIKWTFN
ncbi:MAG: DUF5020 family protein [Tannerellaceae bacterium]|jgi:hypothetical protein|nr:DUF5020 family protein [Tannerellaceae bacterium]